MENQISTNDGPVSTTDPPSQNVWNKRIVLSVIFLNKLARSMFYITFFALASYVFEQRFGIATDDTQFIVSFSSWFAFLRPLLCYWSDTRPILKSRRKTYGQIGNILYILSASLLFGGIGLIFVSVLIYGMGETFSDVAHDSIALEYAEDDVTSKNRIRILMRAGAATGAAFAYLVGGTLADISWEIYLIIMLVVFAVSTIVLQQVKEPSISRKEIMEKIKEEPAFTKEQKKKYKNLLSVMAILIMIPYFGEGLVNVMQEGDLIARYGVSPSLFYGAEFFSAIIGMIVLGVLFVKVPKKSNMINFWYVTLTITALFYFALVFWAPTFELYVFWSTIKLSAGLLTVLVADRVIMDVVKGHQRAWTFQIFILFMSIGAFSGGIVGSILKDPALLDLNGLFILGGIIYAVCPFLLIFVMRKVFKKIDSLMNE
ncbi:MAG: MFS transporter [Promethearchaeota archaeon]